MGSVTAQSHLERRDPKPGSTVFVGTGRFLSRVVQERLVGHVAAGGNLVLLGRVPERDLDGTSCTLLADALGIVPGEVLRDTGHYFPSLVAHGWAQPWPEMRAGWIQSLEHERGDVVLTDVYGAVCGLDVPLGEGRAIVLAAQVPSDPLLFDRALSSLGVTPGLRLETQWPGVFATTTSTVDGQRAVHVINTSGAPATVTVALEGTAIASGATLHVPPRSGHILPLGLEVAGRRLDWGAAEIAGVEADGTVRFRPGLDADGGTTLVVDGVPVRLAPGEHTLAPS